MLLKVFEGLGTRQNAQGLHDAHLCVDCHLANAEAMALGALVCCNKRAPVGCARPDDSDRKSTRLNSSH